MNELISPAQHLAQHWRVHDLARDFELLDVWRFDIRARRDEFPAFVRMARDRDGFVCYLSWSTRALFGLRFLLGRVFGWDKTRVPLPIPGRRERSVAARMHDGRDVDAPRSETTFHPIYEDDREALAELSNATVHGLVHLGWVRTEDGWYAPQMAVYAKHRGLRGRLYMALIGPFRHWIVYPSLMRAVARRWRAEATASARSRRAGVQVILHDG